MSTALELYEQPKPKLGDVEARLLLEFIESSVERRAATKEDVVLLRQDLVLLEERLKRGMSELKSDLIKWTFTFWIGTVAALAGIMFTLLRTMK